jgi:nucleotide-binding universal stress UspA family protein
MTASASLQKPSDPIELHLGTTAVHIKRILLATDFSKQAAQAARLAALFWARLYVLHSVPLQVYAAADITPVLRKMDIEHARKELHAYVMKTPQLRTVKNEEIVLCVPPSSAISIVVEDKRIDLVIVGSKGRTGVNQLVLGSVAEAAVRHLRCPVLIVGPKCKDIDSPPRSLILAADYPHYSLRPAQYAAAIARDAGAALTVVHVLPKEQDGNEDLNLRKRVVETLGQFMPTDINQMNRVRIEVVAGNPASEILSLANRMKAGLIVLGARERGAMADHAPWATMSEVIHDARCPVLAVQEHLI